MLNFKNINQATTISSQPFSLQPADANYRLVSIAEWEKTQKRLAELEAFVQRLAEYSDLQEEAKRLLEQSAS